MNFSIKGFLPTSLVDWPGKISSVIFMAGCGFRCVACHNHRLVTDPHSLEDYPLEEILHHVRRRNRWIDGVTVTGGEPTATAELPRLLKLLKACGVRIKLDTNGSNPGMLVRLIESELVDAVYMDVKAPLEQQHYSRVAGTPVNPALIHRSIRVLKSSGLEVAFRTTVIPGLVEEPELERIVQTLGQVNRYIVQPFRNKDTLSPRLREVKEFSLDRVQEMKMTFEIPSESSRSSGHLAATG